MFVGSDSGPRMEDHTLQALGLVDAPTPEAFDALTRMARRLFNVPVALISIVQNHEDRQFFLSQQGLAEPYKSMRQTPLSHSFCQYVKRDQAPLIVEDARTHSLVRDNLAIRDLGVTAYLGVPIRQPNGDPIGALCVIDQEARAWSDDDLSTMSDLARCVNDEILLRAALASNAAAHERTRRYSAMRESITLAFMAPDMTLEERFSYLLKSSCDALRMGAGRIAKVDCGLVNPLFSYADQTEFSEDTLTTLTQAVLSESAHLALSDLRQSPRAGSNAWTDGCYLGTPLVLGGTLYGVLEFYDTRPRTTDWTSEELSIASAVSMFTTAHLGLFGQISDLRSSEAALLRHLSSTLPGT